MKVIALVNQKGGVAKTTTTAHLAWGLARKGKKVLAIDFDPQGNLSSGMGVNNSAEVLTVFDWLQLSNRKSIFNDIIQKSEGVDVMPANQYFASAETLLYGKLSREQCLKKQIEEIKGKYDYILIDSMPSLGILTINALTAANEILVPIKPEYFCLLAAEQLMDTIKSVRENCNLKIKYNGFLITMVDKRRNVNDYIENIESYAKNVNSIVYKSQIRLSALCADISSYSTSLYAHQPGSTAAKDYESFVNEFLEKEHE